MGLLIEFLRSCTLHVLGICIPSKPVFLAELRIPIVILSSGTLSQWQCLQERVSRPVLRVNSAMSSVSLIKSMGFGLVLERVFIAFTGVSGSTRGIGAFFGVVNFLAIGLGRPLGGSAVKMGRTSTITCSICTFQVGRRGEERSILSILSAERDTCSAALPLCRSAVPLPLCRSAALPPLCRCSAVALPLQPSAALPVKL